MRKIILPAALVAATALTSAAIAGHQDDRGMFHATLTGFQEVTGPGPILSEGNGTLKLKLDRHAKTLTFWLTYSNLTPGAFMAHIHFAPVHVGGSIMVWFCGGPPVTPPAGVQPCPAGGGTVTGTITAADVQSIASQHVMAGDFDALEDALDADSAYVNVHTTAFPAGEIRGQIHRGDGDADDVR
jgi:CHRD domain